MIEFLAIILLPLGPLQKFHEVSIPFSMRGFCAEARLVGTQSQGQTKSDKRSWKIHALTKPKKNRGKKKETDDLPKGMGMRW